MSAKTREKKVKLCKESKELTKDSLTFPDFDTIKVSTKTFIVMTNITLDIGKLFGFLPITNYIVIPKKRGRKKKNEPLNPNRNIPSGSIITLEYENKLRGVDLKKKAKTEKKKRGNYFRNSVTIVMIIADKQINFKVSRNGKFQMTGCKYDEHAEKCVRFIWNYIKDSKDIYTMDEDKELKKEIKEDDSDDSDSDEEKENVLIATFIPAMRNIDFSLNFLVDREKLDEYFNVCTDYHSLLETSFGYTGVNIKIPLTKPITELKLKQLKCVKGKWKVNPSITYLDYLNTLPTKERTKKLNKKRYNTFLVFHSGKCIMSGLEATYMKDTYYEFLNIIRECFDFIEERLDI